MLDLWDELREALGAPGWDSGYDPNARDENWSSGLTNADYLQAIDEYEAIFEAKRR